MQTASHLDKRGEGKRTEVKSGRGDEIRPEGMNKRTERGEGETEVMRRHERSLPKAVTNNMHTQCLMLSITASSEDAL